MTEDFEHFYGDAKTDIKVSRILSLEVRHEKELYGLYLSQYVDGIFSFRNQNLVKAILRLSSFKFFGFKSIRNRAATELFPMVVKYTAEVLRDP